MEIVAESKLRERFQLFFNIWPQLTPSDLVEVLESSNWNERIALRKVYELNNGREISIAGPPSSTPPLDSGAELTPDSSSIDDDEDEKRLATNKLSKGQKQIDIESDSSGDEFIYNGVGTAAFDTDDSLVEQIRPSTNAPVPKSSKVTSHCKSVAGDVLAGAHTTVTKWIRKLVGGLYVKTLLVCDGDAALEQKGGLVALYKEQGKLEGLIDITFNREKLWLGGWTGREYTDVIELIPPIKWQDKRLRKKGYGAAFIDKIRYLPGECVTVRAGLDETKDLTANGRLKTNIKETAASIWFARIIKIFSNEHGEPMAHVRWFSHGGDTFLNETASPKELFLVDKCDDIELTAIAGKIEVERCTEIGPVEDKERFKGVNQYFYRFFYDDNKMSPEKFEDAVFHEESSGRSDECYCCAKREQARFDHSTRVTGHISRDHATPSFSHNGIEYKLYDCIYMLPEQSDEPHTIARIIHIRCEGHFNWVVKDHSKLRNSVQKIHVIAQILRRYDDFNGDYFSEFNRGDKHNVRDSRRLYLTNNTESIDPNKKLIGKCHVVHPNRLRNLMKYKDLDDTFYVADKVRYGANPKVANGKFSLKDIEPLNAEHFRDSADGNEMVETEESRHESFAKAGRKLKAMDVFAGCGGLTSGLRESGAVETLWGIEWDVDASRTLKRNFPSMTVYNEDANVLLHRALLEELGTTKGSVKDLQGNPMPSMPKRGEVEVLYGGPPCQDFSACNRYHNANSIKNSLLTTFLSYVDHYRPKYFLLENVRGLLKHRLGSTQKTKTTVTGGIEKGSVKFIIRALTSLGYSAQFHVLQAAEHGAPQSRRRVFFWGAKMGLRLPLYPQPSHVCKGLSVTANTFNVGRTAPHNAVTVGDAISDLPAFDWSIRVPGEDRHAAAERALRIPRVRLPESRKRPVGEYIQSYASRPVTEFQRQIRSGVTGDRVKNHFTRQWGDVVMLRMARIPLMPGANHNDIPAKYDVPCLRKGPIAARHRFYATRYCRLDYDEQFATCLTEIDPSGENGKTLHPSQCRAISVREYARAQGFLDTFTWDPATQPPEAMYKQIGNAVSLQLGRALGKELFKTLFAQWESETETAISEGFEAVELEDESDFEGFNDDVKMDGSHDGCVFDDSGRNEPILISDSDEEDEMNSEPIVISDSDDEEEIE